MKSYTTDIPNYDAIFAQIKVFRYHTYISKQTEFEIGFRNHLIWSGYDVLQDENFTIQRTNKILNTLQNQESTIWVPGWNGLIVMFRYTCLRFVQSKGFENGITSVVFINTSLLCIQSFYSSDSISIFVTLNYVFTGIFTFEMLVKLIAIGVRSYVRDSLNILDGTIVIMSLMDVFAVTGGGKAAGAFKTLRAFRVLRVTKLFKVLDFMVIILKVISRSLSSFIYILVLLGLFIFIYALLGRQLYAGIDTMGIRPTFETLYFLSII